MSATTARVAERRAERLIEELLSAQGWDIRRPPSGDVLAQQEYKDDPSLRDALAECSKTGPGAGIPEYVLVERGSAEPLAVFEAKARTTDIDAAVADACIYGEAFHASGHTPLAIAVAGTSDERFEIRVLKRIEGEWVPVTYDGNPITWVPNAEQMARARQSTTAIDLHPAVPAAEVLKARAEEINGLLRESGLKDDFRPAAIGAIMLALWKSGGAIRRDEQFILSDVNQSCEQAFWDAEKPELAQSLHVDPANQKLAVRTRRICEILERLNITSLTAEHDYIGALYEEFFRYTGGNTIGQYFTPRHITRLMADLCEVGLDDTVIDIACGTGGFLVAAMQRVQREYQLPHDQVVKLVREHLIGIEDEPVTAALCVANMILRGDGSTGIRRADSFADADFPFGKASVALMNPPFPHKKTDVPPERFIDRSLEALSKRGRAAVIVPSSLLVKADKAKWRRDVLKGNTLLAVISLPGELFQPYAAATTAIVLLEQGVPHATDKPVFFCRIENDGLRIKKGVRVPQSGSQMDDVIKEFRKLGDEPGFCTAAQMDDPAEWAPGNYIDTRPLTDEEFREGVAALIRNKTAFVMRFAPSLAALQQAVERDELTPTRYDAGQKKTPAGKGEANHPTIADHFDIYYGQKALHSKEHLVPGESLIISSSGADNGCYGFFDFADLIEPPFTTVPSTGSIGEACVQEFPCGVTDDCLLLLPKEGTPFEALYVAAATLHHERWRFDYGRKMTPRRIANFRLRLDTDLLTWVREQLELAMSLEKQALSAFAATAGAL